MTVVQDLRPFPLRGEQDLATLTALGSDLREYAAACDGLVLVDCSELEFIDSVAIGALVVVRNELVRNGTRLRLTNVDEFHRRVFEIVGLAELLDDNIA